MKKEISRRDFIAKLAGATALAGCSIGAGLFFHNRRLIPESASLKSVQNFAVPGTEDLMIVVNGNDGALLVKAALQKLGGINKFIKPGDKVLIKPNCAFDRPPHLGATTSPEVVGEIVRQCISAGAEVRVSDNPINNAEGCFVKSGLKDAGEKNGAGIWLPQPALFKRTRVGKMKIKEWDVMYEPLAWATKLIGVPTVKSHNLCGVSLTMKNWYGFLGHGRNRLHQSINEVIADLGTFITPTLVILDGTRILKTNGPTGGSIADVEPGNVIVAGTDQVAIDAYGVKLLKRDISEIKYLSLAEQLGVGTTDYKSLKGFSEISL